MGVLKQFLTFFALVSLASGATGRDEFRTSTLDLAAARQAPAGVLLVTIDTLRADRVGSYGHPGPRTPVLDALAARGVRFADATAHAPLTHPSHAAIMTGRYPGAFGIRLNGMTPLPADAQTIAERFRAAGWSTGAIVASVI